LKTKHGYSLQIRAINARGDISDLTQPLMFHTLEEMPQNNGGIGDNMLLKVLFLIFCWGFLRVRGFLRVFFYLIII